MSTETEKSADPAMTSTEPSTETEQTPTPTIRAELDTGTVLARNSGMRVVGAWSSGVVMRRRIQA